MFNVRLVLTLLNINGLGRKTINKILKYELPTNLEATTILHFLNKCKFNIKKNVQINMENIIEAKNKCEEIILHYSPRFFRELMFYLSNPLSGVIL